LRHWISKSSLNRWQINKGTLEVNGSYVHPFQRLSLGKPAGKREPRDGRVNVRLKEMLDHEKNPSEQ
jgi:hypothetical protein